MSASSSSCAVILKNRSCFPLGTTFIIPFQDRLLFRVTSVACKYMFFIKKSEPELFTTASLNLEVVGEEVICFSNFHIKIPSYY